MIYTKHDYKKIVGECKVGLAVFFGSGAVSESETAYSDTLKLSETAASLGYNIASGGYGGVMEAALRGATEYNVKRIGVTCGIFGDRIPNPYLSDEIKTNTYLERLEILIEIGDVFVAMQGESGALLEVAAVIALLERKLIEDRILILVGDQWLGLKSFIESSEFYKTGRIVLAENVETASGIIEKVKFN